MVALFIEIWTIVGPPWATDGGDFFTFGKINLDDLK